MKILNAIFSVGLAVFCVVALADPPARVGRLNLISGGVSFATAEADNDWAAASLNRPITTGDRLWTERDGRAELHVGSTAIRMSELTGLDVLNLDDERLRLRLAQGRINVRVRTLPGDETFEIDTPNGAVILGRPGSFRIDVDSYSAVTAVIVHYGEAEVLGGASSFRVLAHQQALIPGANGMEYDIVAVPPADGFDDWAAARDRREDRVAAARYVSDQMTGYEDLNEYGSWRVVGKYGSVWAPPVAAGWAPYRYGHWAWISPWGWTWIEDEPWGFAPFHYGRWVWLGNYWAWAPGRPVGRPVYAPALVVFIGGSNWSASVGIGTALSVGWVPLGWQEPYIPWYRASATYMRRVNVAYARDFDVRRIYPLGANRGPVGHIRYVNRSVRSGMSVGSREAFISARDRSRAVPRVTSRIASSVPVFGSAPVATPRRPRSVPSRLWDGTSAKLEKRQGVRSPAVRKPADAAPSARPSGMPLQPRAQQPSRIQRDAGRERAGESAPSFAQRQARSRRAMPSPDRSERRTGPRNAVRPTLHAAPPSRPPPRARARAVDQRPRVLPLSRVKQRGNRPSPRVRSAEVARQRSIGENQRKRPRR